MSTEDLVGSRGATGPRVFLSYSYDRMRTPALALATALRRHGAEVVEPGVKKLGEDVRRHVATSIRGSDLMIVLVSPGDEASRWMQFETRLMLETCWERPNARIAVVAPAVGAIPSALRHQDFVTYYPHDDVRLDSWVRSTAAEYFAAQALSSVGRERAGPAEPISGDEIRAWRNRVVHIGAAELKYDPDQRTTVLAHLRDELSLMEGAGDPVQAASPTHLEQVLDLALLALVLEEPELSVAYYELAHRAYDALHERRTGIEGDVKYRLALVAQTAGDAVTAHDLFEEVVAQRVASLGNSHPATITSKVNLAIAKESLGDLRGAESVYEDALSAARPVLGEFHPQTADVAQRLGVLRAALGDRESARELLRFAEEAYGHVRPDDSSELAEVRRHLVALGPSDSDA